VIAATTLGNIVKQRRDVQQFGIGEIGHQPRAQRILVRVLRLGEASQVANHHQDVLVYGVDVVQVVLHLPDDSTERRQVAAQYAVLVHAPQLVRDAAGLAQDGEKPGTVGRVAPEGRVDLSAMLPQGAQRGRRHALKLRALLKQKEAVEDRSRTPAEACLFFEIEQLVDGLEPSLPPGTGGRAGSGAGLR